MIHLAKNAKVSAVFRHFSDAIRSRDTAQTPQEHESALLSAFKVIEGIASLTTVKTPPETLEAEQQDVTKKLLQKLQSNAATNLKVKAIRESRDALERLEIRFLGLKIPAKHRPMVYQASGRTRLNASLIFETGTWDMRARCQQPPNAIPGPMINRTHLPMLWLAR